MKKLLLTLGTLATIASPIVAVVSCSETKKATHVEIHNEAPFEKARDSLLKVLNHYMFLTPAQKTEYTKNIQGAKTTDELNKIQGDMALDKAKSDAVKIVGTLENLSEQVKADFVSKIKSSKKVSDVSSIVDDMNAFLSKLKDAKILINGCDKLGDAKDVLLQELASADTTAKIKMVTDKALLKQAREEGLALIPTFKSLTQDQRDDYTNRFNDDTKTLDQVNADVNELKQDAFEDYQTNVAAEVQNYKSSDKDTLLTNIQAATTFDEIDRLLKASFDVNKALIDIDGNVELDDTQKTTLNGELDAAKTQLNLDAINDEIGTYVEQNRTRAKTEALTMVNDIYQELTSGNFSLSKFLNDLPDLLDNKNIDANLILSLTKKIEASGIISDNIKDKIAPLFPDTVESSTRLEKLFKNGALKDLYSEITKILTEGIQRQFDVGNVAGTISRYESIFNKFKEAFPVIKDLYAKKIVPAAIDIFTKGVDLSDESIDSLLELINTVLPEEISKEIHFDKLSSLIKTVAAKSLDSLSEIEVNSIIDLVAEFLPSKASLINKIKPYVYKLLFGGMTLEELNGLVESIKPGILATDIPEVGKVSKIVKAVFDGETWLHGGFWHPINSKINSLLNKIIGHTHILFEKGIFGMSSDDLSGMISGIKSAIDSVKGTLDGFLGAIIGAFTDISSIKTILGTISDKAAPIWTDSKSAATLIYGLFHNKLLNIDADSIDKIIEIVNAETGLTIDSNIGASLYELLHNMLLTPKVTILKDLDIIETMAETITRKPIPTQIKETIDKILPIVLNGQQESKS